MSMAIHLAPEIEALIREKVASGLYPSPEEAIAAAMALRDESDRRREALRGMLRSGIAQLDRGEGVEFTPQWSADRVRVVRERAAAGQNLNPDIWR